MPFDSRGFFPTLPESWGPGSNRQQNFPHRLVIYTRVFPRTQVSGGEWQQKPGKLHRNSTFPLTARNPANQALYTKSAVPNYS